MHCCIILCWFSVVLYLYRHQHLDLIWCMAMLLLFLLLHLNFTEKKNRIYFEFICRVVVNVSFYECNLGLFFFWIINDPIHTVFFLSACFSKWYTWHWNKITACFSHTLYHRSAVLFFAFYSNEIQAKNYKRFCYCEDASPWENTNILEIREIRVHWHENALPLRVDASIR